MKGTRWPDFKSFCRVFEERGYLDLQTTGHSVEVVWSAYQDVNGVANLKAGEKSTRSRTPSSPPVQKPLDRVPATRPPKQAGRRPAKAEGGKDEAPEGEGEGSAGHNDDDAAAAAAAAEEKGDDGSGDDDRANDEEEPVRKRRGSDD